MTMVARLLLLLTALAALASPACAPTRPYNPDGLPPAQMSRIGEVCDRVMGLPPGLDTHYQGCQESLSRSLAARREATVAPEPASDAPLPARPARSYFSASNDEVHRRAQAACAAIGVGPSTGAFAQCVADLAGKLFDADNPHWRD